MNAEAGKMVGWMAIFHVVVVLAILGFFGLGSGAMILLALVGLSYFNQLAVDAEALDKSRELVFRYRGKGPIVWPFAKIPEGYRAAIGWFGQECHFQRGGIALIPLFFGEMTLVSVQSATDNVAEALNDSSTTEEGTKKAMLVFPTKDAPVGVLLAVTLRVEDTIEAVRTMAYKFTNPNEPRDALLARASAAARAFCGTKTTDDLIGRSGARDATTNEGLRVHVNAQLKREAIAQEFPIVVSADTANILPAPAVLAAMADREAAQHQAAAGAKRAEVIGAEEKARSEGEVGGLVAAAKGLDAAATVRVTQLAQAMGTMRAGNNPGSVFISGDPGKLEIDVRGTSRGGDGDDRRRPDSKGRDKSDKKGS